MKLLITILLTLIVTIGFSFPSGPPFNDPLAVCTHNGIGYAITTENTCPVPSQHSKSASSSMPVVGESHKSLPGDLNCILARVPTSN